MKNSKKDKKTKNPFFNKKFKVIGIMCISIILIELIIMGCLHIIRENKICYLDTLYSIKNINNDYYLAVGSSNFKHSHYNDTKIYEYEDEKTKSINKAYAEQAKLVKLDSELNVIFEKTFKTEYDSTFYDVELKDNFIYAVGNYVYNSKQLSINTRDGLLVKYDLDGNFIWSKNYQVLGNTSFKRILIEDDGIIAVGQSIYENMEIGNHDQGGGIIVKYDFDGNILWKNNFGGNKSGIFEDIKKVDDGYIVCGKDALNYGLLVKFDFNGKRLWVKNYTNTDELGMSKMDIKDQKIYIATARNVSDKVDSEGNNIYLYNASILVFDLEGKFLNNYDFGGSKSDRFNSLLLLDNSIIAVGYTMSKDININNLKYREGMNEGIIVEFDYEGKILNKKVYGGAKREFLTGIIETIPTTENKINNTKSYTIIGYTNSRTKLLDGNNKDYFSKIITYDQNLEILNDRTM